MVNAPEGLNQVILEGDLIEKNNFFGQNVIVFAEIFIKFSEAIIFGEFVMR